jgi:alpha-N-acetylglucosamine transferase
MSNLGIIYICFGSKAIDAMLQSSASLNCHNNHEIIAVTNNRISGINTILFDDLQSKGRWSKVNLDQLSPFDYTLYLDSDTRINGNLDIYFDTLMNGYDLTITPSKNQGSDLFWHLSKDDRTAVYQSIEFQDVLQLQAGVFSFRKSPAIFNLFQSWRSEWKRFKGQDQGALIRALYNNPVKLYLLSSVFNGGTVINHLFGKLR